jgi:hypothetical protein
MDSCRTYGRPTHSHFARESRTCDARINGAESLYFGRQSRPRPVGPSMRLSLLSTMLSLALLPCGTLASTPAASDETFTTAAFAIGPENVSRVTSVSSRGDLIVLHVTVGACTGGPDAPLILHVHGAPPHVFHVGQLVATGASAPPGRGGIAAVRTVAKEELPGLGCPR